jgi:hypothetical protein
MTSRALEKSLLSFALIGSVSAVYATPGASSAYNTDSQSSHVEDATSRGVNQVNMITCIMSSLKPDALVNEGSYLALVDETKCDAEGRSSTSNSGGSDGTQSTAFLTATITSTRASNSEPMLVKGWIDESAGEDSATIFVRISATEAPTRTNPYGVFRLDYCGRSSALPGCIMNGYLEGTTSGLNYFEVEGDSQGRTIALRLNATGTTAGSGRMHVDEEMSDTTFAFAYNADLFRRSDDNGEQCFTRDASDPATGFSVWRYGLYDADSGARITRNSGFPIEYTSNGTIYHGYLGYWGLNLPPEAMSTLTNGATVQKVDYSNNGNPTKTNYFVVKSDGKLTKYTKKTRTLHDMDKIKFMTFVGNDANDFFAGAMPNTQYELYWDDANGVFTATGMMSCGENGCQTQDLPSTQTVPVSYWAMRGGVPGWSQALGGEVFIALNGATGSVNSTAVEVVYRVQDLIYPSDLPQTLYCLRDCPTAASMSGYFADGSSDLSPFIASTFNNWNPTAPADVVQYGSDIASATLLDANGAPVSFSNAEALSARPQFQNGIRTGRLFTNLASAECETGSGTYCDWRVNNIDVYYQWETGANPWNQFAAVKNSSGDFVEFDAPLQVTFEVPAGAAYGQYAGKSIVLQYGGFGDLWGIPGYCVSRLTNAQVSCETPDSRYVPLFVIPFNETQGRVTADGHTYLVKWLDREIRFARKSLSVCDQAGLTVPSGVSLPSASDLRNPSDPSSSVYIGAKPTVTDAPRVIDGDVKY